MHIVTEKIQQVCKICGHLNHTAWYYPREMMFGSKDEFLYFQCTRCECLQIAEFPANISKYYPKSYYSLQEYDDKKFGKGIGSFKRLVLKASVGKTGLFYRSLQKLFPSSQSQLWVLNGLQLHSDIRILDVGCGNGYKFLYPLAEAGFHGIMGCDPYIQKEINYPNGLKILKTDVFGITGKWDVITWHHSFEHISNPLQSLKQVAALLSQDGVCIIRIPTVSSYAWHHYKTNWYQLDAPRHYFLHSVKSMEYMAQHTGFKLQKVLYDSTHRQFTESERYEKGIALSAARQKGFLPFIKRKIRKFQYVKRTNYLNKAGNGDQAAFYLVKA